MSFPLNIPLIFISQIVAAIMAITGIVMMAYADGFHGDSIIGVALAVGSASTSALYKVSAVNKNVILSIIIRN